MTTNIPITSAVRWLVPNRSTARSLIRTPIESMKASPTAESGDGPEVSTADTNSPAATPLSAATTPADDMRRRSDGIGLSAGRSLTH